jgi:hypothetical protein
MKRLSIALVACGFALVGALAGCDKPTADECKAALEHMQELIAHQQGTNAASDVTTEIRACRGGSTKESVACATNAKTLDDLKACKFMAPKSASSN